jgi:RNA-binding protein
MRGEKPALKGRDSIRSSFLGAFASLRENQHMSITDKQKRWLKKQVHHLKPVVTLGQAGLTEPVLAEIEIALNHHELIKVRINAGDRELRDAAIGTIASRTNSDLINRIGNIAAFFRANPETKEPIKLPAD